MRFLIVVLICFFEHSTSFANDTLPKPFGLEFGTPKSDLMHLKSDNYDQSRSYKKKYKFVPGSNDLLIENPPRKPSDSTYFLLRFDPRDRLAGIGTYLDGGTERDLSQRAYDLLKDILIKKYASPSAEVKSSQDGTREPYTLIYGDGVRIALSMSRLEESEYIVTISYTRAPVLELSGY